MKKINFNLKEKSSLSKDQMRKIVGGYGDGCGARCSVDADCGFSGPYYCMVCNRNNGSFSGSCGQHPIY